MQGGKTTEKEGKGFTMLPEHYIQWIYLETNKGGQRHELAPGGEPKTVFALAEGEKAVAAYAYCNLHGLWKTDV